MLNIKLLIILILDLHTPFNERAFRRGTFISLRFTPDPFVPR